MMTRTWIRRLFARTPRTIRKAPARFRPILEALEDRLAPASFTVTTNADTGTGSLRAAVVAANKTGGSNLLTFDPTLFATAQTITLTSDDPNLAFGPTALVIAPGDNLTIEGDPTQAGVTLDGGGSHRLFGVYAGASLTLEYLTLTGGKAQGGAGGNVTGGAGGG